MKTLSPRRLRIARGQTEMPSAMRASYVRKWQAEGYDCSEFIEVPWKPTFPSDRPAVDVVVPFHAGDSQWLGECLRALDLQRGVEAIAHVVADSCDFPTLPVFEALTVMQYQTPETWGPYRIANSLVRWGHCEAEWLAIQDADDISLPDRFWRQIQTLRHHNADMISSAMNNFMEQCGCSKVEEHFSREPICEPGVIFASCSLGRVVNSSRTMRRAFFEQLNGFADMLCSGDFQIDTRARCCGTVIDDHTVLGRRRLHAGSLSHGIVPLKSPERDAFIAVVTDHQSQMLANPTIETAARLGSLRTAPPLTQKPPVCGTGGTE